VTIILIAKGASQTALDPEGLAMLTFIVFPISVAINLTLIYLLSILEKAVLDLRFLVSSTAIGELATIILGFYLKYDLSYVFIAHLLAIVAYFFLWQVLLRRRVLS
jgi:hypothetical protein